MCKDIAEIRRKNLASWMEQSGMNQSEIARKLEVGRAYLSLLQRRHFGEKSARSIEQKLRLPVGYLDADADQPKVIDEWSVPSDLPPDVYAIVPRVDVRLSAGGGCIAERQDDLPPLAFRRDWLQKKLVTAKKNLRVVSVHGDSMEPLLFEGDIVLIDMGQCDIREFEVFAIRYCDELRIKRLSKRVGGGLLIRSDNKNYTDELLSATEAEEVSVIGRMLWRGG